MKVIRGRLERKELWCWPASDLYGFSFSAQIEACAFLDVVPNLGAEFTAIWLHVFYLHVRSSAEHKSRVSRLFPFHGDGVRTNIQPQG